MEVTIKEETPSPFDYNCLRKSVGWGEYDEATIRAGLESTLYCVCAFDSARIIGMGRVIGDGALCFYIQDIIVIPEYQRNAIGKMIMGNVMRFVASKAATNTVVGLMSAQGKERFYEGFGFTRRPAEALGSGMTLFWPGTGR